MTEPHDKGECTFDGICDKPIEKSGLCAKHRKRKQREKNRAYQKKHPGEAFGRPRLERGEEGPDLARWADRDRFNPLQALARAGRELADADAEMANRKFENVAERFRAALRRYVSKHLQKKSNPAAPKE